MSEEIQNIIDRALYGNPEIKPEEKNLFLTTFFRENPYRSHKETSYFKRNVP